MSCNSCLSIHIYELKFKVFNIKNHVAFFSSCVDTFTQPGSLTKFSMFATMCGDWQVLCMIEGQSKKAGHFSSNIFFPYSWERNSCIFYTNISYECSGLRLLWLPLFWTPITSTPHLPKEHQNIWSDNILPSHNHVINWLTVDTFNEIRVGGLTSICLIKSHF